MPWPAALYNHRKWQLIGKSWRAMLQLQHTPPPQSTAPGLHPVIIRQMAPPVRGSKHPITAYYSVWRPRKVEGLSRPGWLVTYPNKVPPPRVKPDTSPIPVLTGSTQSNFVDTTNSVTTTPRRQPPSENIQVIWPLPEIFTDSQIEIPQYLAVSSMFVSNCMASEHFHLWLWSGAELLVGAT